jgi:16S rRNA (adenine(1408)-N(1))-methyltransferase
LDGVADALTVQFPWGSLLNGLLGADPVILDGLRRVTRPGATVTLLLSVTERDCVVGAGPLDATAVATLAARFACHGLAPVECRPARADDLRRSHSSWAKRLGAGTQRVAWLARFRT